MRIICLEEHVNDPVVAQAVQEAFFAEVPYVKDIGSRYRDNPDLAGSDRPQLTFLPDSMKTATEPLQNRLAAMDQAGIDMQVVSLSNEPQLADKGSAVDLARGANDRLAEAVARHPRRFSAFFTLPWQDPDGAVREAERCVRELGLPATMLTGRPGGEHFIDDARFDPVLSTLAELGAPIYIHPGPPLHSVQRSYYSGFDPDVSARFSLFGWGWHHEAGIQVIRLILSGALDRHRNLKIISGHWGEMVPFYLQRMDDTMPPDVTGLSRTISKSYRDQVWVGPSGMLDLPHFQFVREVMGIDRIVYSIDYPYLTLNGARQWLEELPIPPHEKEAIAYRNAEQLLGLRRT
ncbi:amidohydrolase family protein [Stakelama tenebrarum]|uniref:Amidohydrolase n=1 Tax=Stakelama tenebrarum TaxID=2711215 RepID=A0A6G6Y102_9SPHN|nr:amidohydrolase family protein [Sphingosinithalassobacter tenebrarum]QIG78624.1 amidohydrolase [Sphingosinithalassobacter tenebrarum]